MPATGRLPISSGGTERRPIDVVYERPLVLTHRVWSAYATVRFLLLSVVLVVVYAAADVYLIEGPPPAIDVTILDWFVGARTQVAIDASRILTFLGDAWVVLLVGALTVIFAWRHGGRRDLTWFLALVVIGVLIVTGVIKDLTDRPRPDGALIDAISFAFPSGHAARAAAVYALVAWLAIRWTQHGVRRVAIVAVAVVMAAATGVSRLVLGVHWPSDVLFGWILGVVWTTACVLIVAPRHGPPRRKRPDLPGRPGPG